ncbi:unnamed protein product [Prunus armeniaca]
MIQTDRLYSADDLYMLRQGEDKPLREYAARFSHEYSRCPDTDDRAAFGAFKSGLRESNFRYLVHSNPWNTYAELMKQAAVHAKAEYFNSKRSPAIPAHNPFADPPPASVPIPSPPQHFAPTPSTPKGRIATSIPSAITSGADMGTTTSLVEATPPGQMTGPHSHSHPSPGSRSSPPSTLPMRMS